MYQVKDTIQHIFNDCPQYTRLKKSFIDVQRRIGESTRYPDFLQSKDNPNIQRT
ncbi:hypothetical protein CHS0354_041504, partial [Potamilus streckersoni]